MLVKVKSVIAEVISTVFAREMEAYRITMEIGILE